jgi:hypothetical protein
MLAAISRVEGFKTGKIVSAADGGVFSGPTKGYPATLHGTEAVIPMSDGKSIPVKFDKPDRQQLVDAYKDMFKTLNPSKTDSINISDIVDEMSKSMAPVKFEPPSIQQLIETYGDAFRTLIPGMTVNKQGDGLAIELGSVADKLSMAVDEMFAAMPEMKKQFNYGKMEPGDFMRAMLATPEGKVFSAQNDIGVQGLNGPQTEESKALRGQYDLIREMIRQQDSAAIKAGKMAGGSIEDPLSRMEVLAEDYVKRQQIRTGWGTGDWQTGEVGKQNLFDENSKVITELVKGLQENTQTATEDKVTGILEKFTNSFKEMFTQQSTQGNAVTPELIGAIQEMVQAQRDNVSISSKILQVSQN